MPSPTDDEVPFPPLSHSALHRSHLSPNDAFASPTRRPFDGDGAADSALRLSRLHGGERSSSRRRKRAWKKLMWVKQSYPDNYTDQATFLENLQRNPRLKPYDFWPLVADSTVILQHVCSVIIFIVNFIAIFQNRVSPVSVVSWSSVATFLGWILWERWVAEEEDLEEEFMSPSTAATAITRTAATMTRRRTRAGSLRRPVLPIPVTGSAATSAASSITNLDLEATSRSSRTTSAADVTTATANGGGGGGGGKGGKGHSSTDQQQQTTGPVPPSLPLQSPGTPVPEIRIEYPANIAGEESRIVQRLGTIKSAMLIYSTLLGLSPILKSLTKSTSSDSIWAMSFWLLATNIFFFDYSGGVGAKFPASLSTNAALMASTVLASRLPDTTQVFSLTLFSIQVFGLFPVFRRHVRHRSWRYHVLLTVLLVLGAGFGVGMVHGNVDKTGHWPWRRGAVGMVVGVVMAALAAGGCSWWLIGLQKYKNEIRGPWDPARPIIMSRPRWD